MASVSNITNKVVKQLGKQEVVLAETGSSQKGACVGLSLANLTGGVVTASVLIEDSYGTKGFYIKDLFIAPNSSARIINGGEKLLLAPSNTIKLVSSWDAGIDALLSLVVITYT